MLQKSLIQIVEWTFLIHPKEGKNWQSLWVYIQSTHAHAYVHILSFQSIQHIPQFWRSRNDGSTTVPLLRHKRAPLSYF